MTSRAVLIGAAVFAAAFGLLAYRMSRRKGVPAAGLTTFFGIAGVYTGFWGVMERMRWLYAPCVVLILASYAIDLLPDAAPAPGTGHLRLLTLTSVANNNAIARIGSSPDKLLASAPNAA